MSFFWKVFLFLFVITHVSWAKGSYSGHISPDRAEEFLSQFSNRAPIDEEKWISILGAWKDKTYTVTRGDTLWGISSKLFKDPFLWRKIWEENAFITNPHELKVGEALSYFHTSLGREPSSTEDDELPVSKITPQNSQGMDLDEGAFANVDMKNRFIPSLLVISPSQKIFGEISGSYSPGDGQTLNEGFFVKPNPSHPPVVGEQYSIIHIEENLENETRAALGNKGKIVTLVGLAVMTSQGERYFKAELKEASGMVRRGDKLIAAKKPIDWSVSVDPPNDLQAKIIVGELFEARLFAQGQTVLLNKGKQDGMQQGFNFRVWKDTDGNTELAYGVEPESKGELRVISVSEHTSLAYIVRNNLPIEVGDTAVPMQVFLNPTPPPQKDFSQVEFE